MCRRIDSAAPLPVNDAIVVVDLQRNAIATMTVGSTRPKSISFIDSVTLAFSEVVALKPPKNRSPRICLIRATTEL